MANKYFPIPYTESLEELQEKSLYLESQYGLCTGPTQPFETDLALFLEKLEGLLPKKQKEILYKVLDGQPIKSPTDRKGLERLRKRARLLWEEGV